MTCLQELLSGRKFPVGPVVGLAVDPAVPLAIVYDDLDYDETDLQDCADAIY